MRIVTADLMRALDRRTIEELGVPGVVLMETAGRGAAAVLAERLGDVGSGPVAVVCGGGNNGGDGMVIARCLHERRIPVQVYALVPAARYGGDAAVHAAAVLRLGIPYRVLGEEGIGAGVVHAWRSSSVVVDAIFGTGLARNVEGRTAEAIDGILESGRPVLSVDVPSGIDSDTGQVLGHAVRATWTATFAFPKRGLYIYPGAEHAGEIVCIPIGIPWSYLEGRTPVEELLDPTPLLDRLRRCADTHKGTYGHLLVLAGSCGKSGAGSLCSVGALRSGAGLVTLGGPGRVLDHLDGKPSEIMTLPLPGTDQGTLAETAWPEIEQFMKSVDGLVIGPGLGIHKETEAVVRHLWQDSTRPMVWDADGLTLLARNGELRGRQRAAIVVTPHPGEMSRLLDQPIAWIQQNRVEAVKRFSEAWGVVSVLKGARTLIAAPEGDLRINLTGNPGMAIAGMGDVLSGMIGAFLARGFGPMDAASLGVWLHGTAGDLAARRIGPAGFLASEVAAAVPAVLRERLGYAR